MPAILSLLLESCHPAPDSLQHCQVLIWAQPCTCHVMDDVAPGRTLDIWRGPEVSKSRLVCQKASVRLSSGSCRPLPLSLALHSRTLLRAVGQRLLDGGSPVYPSCSRQILLFHSLPIVSRPSCMASLLKTRLQAPTKTPTPKGWKPKACLLQKYALQRKAWVKQRVLSSLLAEGTSSLDASHKSLSSIHYPFLSFKSGDELIS